MEGVCFSPYALKLTTVVWWHLSLAIVLAKENFWHEILHDSDSYSVHHQWFIHCTLSNGICHTAVYKPVWHILVPLLSVQWINWWWTEQLSESCRISCQNKFVKLVHRVGFIKKKFVTIRGHMNVKNFWLCMGEMSSRKNATYLGNNLWITGCIWSPIMPT